MWKFYTTLILFFFMFGGVIIGQNDTTYNLTFIEESDLLELDFENYLQFFEEGEPLTRDQDYRIEEDTIYSLEEAKIRVRFFRAGKFTMKIKEFTLPEITINPADKNRSITIQIRINSVLNNFEAYDIVDAEQIRNSGRTTLTEILHYYVPGFYGLSQTIADGTDQTIPVAFRGLSPDQLLLLINGKRINGSALLNINGTVGRGTVGKDLNIIPIVAIEQVEFYKAGAGTFFGSDAIAGVINITLKESAGRSIIDYKTGTTYEGDGTESRLSMHTGVNLKGKGAINFSGEYLQMDGYNRSEPYTGNIYGDSRDNNAQAKDNFFNHLQEEYNLQDKKIMKVGRAETQDASFLVNGNFQLSDSASLYMIGNTHFRKGSSFGNYRLPSQTAEIVQSLYPYGFLPEIQSSIQNNFFIIGLRKNFGKWNAEISNSYGKNSIDFNVNGSNNVSLGISTPTYFNSGGLSYAQNSSKFDLSGSFFSSPHFKLKLKTGAEVRSENYSIKKGEEASYKGNGVSGFPGFQPDNEINEWRRNFGAFASLEGKYKYKDLIIKLNGGSRYERYSDFDAEPIVQVAARVTKSNIFVDGFSISIRSSYNQGFRAPSLQQRFFNNRSVQRNGQVLEDVYTFGNLSPIARQLGFKSLTPEKSSNTNFGLEMEYSGDNGKTRFTASFDRYSISIRNRIVLSGRFNSNNLNSSVALETQRNIFKNFLTTNGYELVQGFINGIETTTTGIDAYANFHREFSKKDVLNLSWRGNFFGKNAQQEVKKNSTSTDENPQVLISEQYLPALFKGSESILFDKEQITRYEDAQSQFRSIVQANWEHRFNEKIKAFRLDVIWNVFGQVASAQNGEQFEDFSTKIGVIDVSLSVRATIAKKSFTLSIGGNNVGNIKPEENEFQDSGRFPYSRRVQQFGMAGGMWFTRLYIDL